MQEVPLYGDGSLPSWVHKLKLDIRFVFHNARKLFREEREGAQEDDAEGDREATRVAGGVAGVHSPQGHRAIVSWISSRSRPSTRG